MTTTRLLALTTYPGYCRTTHRHTRLRVVLLAFTIYYLTDRQKKLTPDNDS